MLTKKKAKKKARRPALQWFIQPMDPYRKDIFVCTGVNQAKDITTIITKKIGAKAWMGEWVVSKEAEWQKAIDAGCAFVDIEPKHGAAIIRLRDYSDNWEFWETLIHELNHLMYLVLDGHIRAIGETEAHAYCHEFMFREIRRKLQGIDPMPTYVPTDKK